MTCSDEVDADSAERDCVGRTKIYLVSRQAVVHETVKSLKWRRVKKSQISQLPPFDIGWIESADLNFYHQIRAHQRVSQTPGMEQLSRKKNLCRNLNAMRASFLQEYDIFPKSWLLPEGYPSLMKFLEENPKSVIIVKPDGRCQGRGIFLTSKRTDIQRHENQVCQIYIDRPYLLNGFKFDLRLYVLLASVDPLRVFLYDDGIVRLCTEPYKSPNGSNISSVFMHLTNYAINKCSDAYHFNLDQKKTDSGSKWTVKSLFQWLESTNSNANTARIWSEIHLVIAKAIISGSAHLRHQYRVCYPMHNNGALSFQLLGFDILLDEQLKPWLIEINRNPSLKCDTPLDHKVKSSMLQDLFAIVVPQQDSQFKASFRDRLDKSIGKPDRTETINRQFNLEFERSQKCGFKMILPPTNLEGLPDSLYSRLILENQRIFENSKRKHDTIVAKN